MNWELRLKKLVKKEILRFPRRDQEQLRVTLREMSWDPYTGDIVKLHGEKNGWRRRVGAYRVFYELILEEKVVYVFRIERRTSSIY